MIQIHEQVLHIDRGYDGRDREAIEERKAMARYLDGNICLVGYRSRPTEELKVIVDKYDRKSTGKSFIGQIFDLFFSNGEGKIRAMAARQVLEERAT